MLFSCVDALVQLQCGTGNVVSAVTTNKVGVFSILLDPSQFSIPSLLRNCSLVIATPLATCNSSLPGSLITLPLQLIRTTFIGLLPIFNIIPVVFGLIG